MFDLSGYDFSPVINYPDPAEMKVFDFTQGYDPEYVRSFEWGVGRYDEKRRDMYTAPQYKNRRNIHMGIDIYCKVGEPVFSFYDGKICYKADLDQPGNYGPTIILRYNLNNLALYALYGHLSRASLDEVVEGEQVKKGQKIATIGSEKVNGGWVPHLHFQLSLNDPGKADMLGVVSDDSHESSLEAYPDPRLVTGPLY